MNSQNKKSESVTSIIAMVIGIGAFVVFVLPFLGMLVICGLLAIASLVSAGLFSDSILVQITTILLSVGFGVFLLAIISKSIKNYKNRKKNKVVIKNQDNNIQQKENILKQFSWYGKEEFEAISKYIQQAQSLNYTKEMILEKLVKSGWQEEYVKEMLKIMKI